MASVPSKAGSGPMHSLPGECVIETQGAWCRWEVMVKRAVCVSDIFLIKSKRCQLPRATAAQAEREDPDLQEKKERKEEGE